MTHAIPPAIVVASSGAVRRPIYAIYHDNNEYWVYLDKGVYRTCKGVVVPLTAAERKQQPHPERLDVTCDDNRLDAHALDPTPAPRRHK